MIPQETNHKVQEINQFFFNLINAIQNKSNPEIVNRSIRAIIYEISEITEIGEKSLGGQGINTEPGEIISEVRSLLN